MYASQVMGDAEVFATENPMMVVCVEAGHV
jgi:hypothetical protein